MEYPFQIFQTPEHVAFTFTWSQVYRLIYTNGKAAPHEGIESWMGYSRGRWEGDTLTVQVADQNDKTWFDMAGNFHSEALKVAERYTMLDADTIQYEATLGSQGVHQALKIACRWCGKRIWTVSWNFSVRRKRRIERRLRARSTHLVSEARLPPRHWAAGRDAAERPSARG